MRRPAILFAHSAATALRALTTHGMDHFSILCRVGVDLTTLFAANWRRGERRAACVLYERATAEFPRAPTALHAADVLDAVALFVGFLYIAIDERIGCEGATTGSPWLAIGAREPLRSFHLSAAAELAARDRTRAGLHSRVHRSLGSISARVDASMRIGFREPLDFRFRGLAGFL
jgi:hypothetical protein